MKNKIITLAIFSIILTSVLSARELQRDRIFAPAHQVAEGLVAIFDTDSSDALNKLELSEAISYLSSAHPMLTNYLDYTTGIADEKSAPPRIAYNLVVGFDSNYDVQLTEEELTLAISYLRKLNRNNGSFVAMAE